MQILRPTFVLRKNLSLFLRVHVANTLHEHARRHSTEPPLITHLHGTPHISRSNGPPLSMFTPNRHEPNPPEEISDLEWEIRTGRAIYVLEQTLPDFFQVGLVSSLDPTKPETVEVSLSDSGAVESIYSPAIRLTYTPPVVLPPPLPGTLSIEGLALYMVSSVFIRHTMKTLYSDLQVEMRKLMVQTPSATSPDAVVPTSRRDKSVFVGLTVHGTTRVSGGPGEWQVDSTYGFSPVSGRIHLHTIDSILPAPHDAAYDALRAALGSVFGLGPGIRPGQAR